MAKLIKSKVHKKTELIFPLEKINYIILGIGLIVIVAGYIALSVPTVEGFSPLVLAPILLIVGYCVLIPLGILYTRKEKSAKATVRETVKG